MSPRRRQFRLTTWPGAPLQLPPLLEREHYTLDPARRLLVSSGTTVERHLNGQTVLKLLRLDLDDPEAICAFANQYGVMNLGHLDEQCFDWLSYYLPRKADEPPGRFRYTQLYQHLFEPTGGLPYASLEEQLEYFQFAARCLILLAQAWRFLQGEIEAREVRSSCGLPLIFPHFSSLSDSHIHWVVRRNHVISVKNAQRILGDGLTAALTRFHPRVLSPDPYRPNPEPESRKKGVTARQKLREPVFSLYLLCCLELFNHIVSGATFRECAADDCNVVFDFQEGRAKYGQHRHDAIYCDPTCKNRQAQRNRRRRLRKNQNTGVSV